MDTHGQTKTGGRIASREGDSIFGVAEVQDTLLSDGSTVFDVVIRDGQDRVTINALSQALAFECASRINFAIKLATGQSL